MNDIFNLSAILETDAWVHTHIVELYMPTLTEIMIAITTLDNPLPMFVMVALIAILFIKRRDFENAILFLASIFSSVVIMYIIKELIHRERPIHYLIEVSGYSFPSGHATLSTVFAMSLYLIFRDTTRYKKTLLTLAIVYPLLISFTRVYLNVHNLSDVIAGIALGMACTSLVFHFKIQPRG